MSQSKLETKPRRNLLWTGAVLVVLVLLSAVAIGVVLANMNEVPSASDTSTTRASDNGLFTVSYSVPTGAIPLIQAHQWILHVETAEGQPVENATIAVDGGMPAHGHGLPAQPQVTEYLGDGDYLVEDVLFSMTGAWVMDFQITAGGQSDTVRFDLVLE